MAVVVMWDDGTEARWESAKDWASDGGRNPYHLFDEKGNQIVTVPDFGVRYLAIKSPDEVTEPERGPNDLVVGRIRDTD